MKIDLFKMIADNKVEYDERIWEEKKDIQIQMLLLIKIAFCITLIIECFNNKNPGEKLPILYYTILLEMTIEPFLRCLRGAFDNPKEFILSIVIGCTIAGTSVLSLNKIIFTNAWICIALSVITVVIMYFIYVWAYNFYFKKQGKE